MNLKRHVALQPLSRDHLIGLFHAQRLIKLAENCTDHLLTKTIEAFSEAWHSEIVVHFADEDRLFRPLPVAEKSLARLEKEHIELTKLIERVFEQPYSASLATRVGSLLDAHIRWEEHDLFPEIETTLSESQLAELATQTQRIEASRHRQLFN